ncbi:oxidoreductase domain-containing protein [Biscogniauxia sp. FL1348]|nr:oxidoreductase domain-containing protein [Biscogniauxia sp. FL1348]
MMAGTRETLGETKILSGPTPASAAARIVDFEAENLEEYAGYFITLIENILTPNECNKLLSLVQPADNASWPPAVITAYDGSQRVDQSSRNCGRIIYDSQPLADRLLERILPHLPPGIITLDNAPDVTGQDPVLRKEKWAITSLAENLRFLKYGPGNYFRPHADGHFIDDKAGEKSYLAMHLYLNGGGEDEASQVEGGATRFAVDFEDPHAPKLDVNPEAGSLVVFQQRDLYHEGCEVTKGIKYTVRSDIIYNKV